MLHQEITERILKSAFTVHSALGAGLLESTYNACLHYEFTAEGLQFEHQVRLPVVYQGIQLDAGYRTDYLVENCVIVELKAVEKLLPLHTAQILSYLKLSTRAVGLLINFNVVHLSDGIRRVVNGYPVPVNGYPVPTDKGLPSMSSASSVVESFPATQESNTKDTEGR